MSDPPRVPSFLVPRSGAGVAHAPAAGAGCPDRPNSPLPEREATMPLIKPRTRGDSS